MSEAATTTMPQPNAGDLVAGRYRLERLLGMGAMGWVFEAQDGPAGRVAVKLLRPSAAVEEDAARFQRETRVGQNLPSPHLVAVLDAGKDPRTALPYLVMPLLNGFDLGTLLQRVGPLAPGVAVRILAQAAVGLAAAHRAGVLHRDVKPSNLFLHQDTPDSIVVKLIDFGLAKPFLADQPLTHTGTLLGSPLFMSPEQARDPRGVDERADVWGLGATLYAALAGKAPWEGRVKGLSETLAALATQDVPPLQDAAPWIPTRLAEIVHGALVRDRDARCPTVRALLEALEQRTGGTLQLRPSMLVAASAELMKQRPALARLPRAWSDLFVKEAPAVEARDPGELAVKSVGSGIELVRLLGRGGMGAVYEGNAAGKRVAVKVMLDDINPGLKPDAVKRFIREARAVMAIDSPHVVRVLEADTDPKHGRPYIVMEFLEGQDLERFIRKHGALETGPVVRLFVQACQGLKTAHGLGIVHRDIKPANLFVQQLPSGEALTKICDFGVAKNVLADGEENATALTRTGGILGSPMYMSPEQANNSKQVDLRTDIWSLGASLYEALSGHKLWGDALSLNSILIRLCTEDPPPLREKAPWLPEGLCQAVHRALRRKPEERYLRADEFAAALAPFAGPAKVVLEDLRPCKAALDHHPQPAAPGTPAADTEDAPTEHVSRQQPRRAPWIWVGGGLAVLGVAAAVALGGRPGSAHRIQVNPPQAQVTVNGEPRALVDGVLVLEGEPGDSFAITVREGGRSTETSVVIPRRGPVTPSVIDLGLK